jgi:N-methylhydantoinase A
LLNLWRVRLTSPPIANDRWTADSDKLYPPFEALFNLMRITIDTGGTFTDCVYLKEGVPAVLKVLSTPDDPARSVLEAIREIVTRVAAGLQARERPDARVLEVRHGTTIGTNALLERKGARVAFVTTAGFEETIAIGRQARQDLYNWLSTPKPCLVPAELRFGVRERVSAEGEILLAPTAEELAELSEKIRASGAESVAISLLFSFANPANEKRVTDILRDLGPCGSDTRVRPQPEVSASSRPATANVPYDELSDKSVRPTRPVLIPISVSHEVLPEFREYERAATVVVNAYLAPKAGGYMQRLESAINKEHNGSLYVMQSSGGIISAQVASQEPVRTVLSGPAGGVVGAHRVARLAGFEKIIAFDMGGTSTDVSLIDASGPRITSEARVSEIPISVPMLDIHTVGAGGGSLAWFDRGGILHVGPASAGADPGPICYGSGEQPTVTDANLVLGRLDPKLSLAGTVALDEARARRFMESARTSIASIEGFAAGIVQLADAEMEKAIRLISVERGHDPREFTLVCFGGAGPLHACALARALGIPRVMVPAMPGALSALGILMSDVVRDYSRTVMISIPPQPETKQAPSANSVQSQRPLRLKAFQCKDRPGIARGTKTNPGEGVFLSLMEPHFAELEFKGTAEFSNEGLVGTPSRCADLRYAGQGYELNVPAGPDTLAEFHAAHRKRYGHADETRAVEVVNVRVRMTAASEPIRFPRIKSGASSCDAAIIKRKRVMFDSLWLETPVYRRDLFVAGNAFEGPAIVHEYSATTVMPPSCKARVDEYSNIVIEV